MFIKYKIFGKAEIAMRQAHKKFGVIIWLVWMDIPFFLSFSPSKFYLHYTENSHSLRKFS